jgi:hypothetical protein
MPLDNLLHPSSPETEASGWTDPHRCCSANAPGDQECAKRATEENTPDRTIAMSCDVQSEGLQKPWDSQEAREPPEARDLEDPPPCTEPVADIADQDGQEALEAGEAREEAGEAPRTDRAVLGPIWPDNDRGENGGDYAEEPVPPDVIRLVFHHLNRNVVMLETGWLQYIHALKPSSRRERAVLQPLSPKSLVRDLRIRLEIDGEHISPGLLRDLVDRWIEAKAKYNLGALWDRIDQPLTDEQRTYARSELYNTKSR